MVHKKIAITGVVIDSEYCKYLKQYFENIKGVRTIIEDNELFVCNIGKTILSKMLKKYYLEGLEHLSDEFESLESGYKEDNIFIFADEEGKIFSHQLEAEIFYLIYEKTKEENQQEELTNLCSIFENETGKCISYGDKVFCFKIEGKSDEDIENLLSLEKKEEER